MRCPPGQPYELRSQAGAGSAPTDRAWPPRPSRRNATQDTAGGWPLESTSADMRDPRPSRRTASWRRLACHYHQECAGVGRHFRPLGFPQGRVSRRASAGARTGCDAGQAVTRFSVRGRLSANTAPADAWLTHAVARDTRSGGGSRTLMGCSQNRPPLSRL